MPVFGEEGMLQGSNYRIFHKEANFIPEFATMILTMSGRAMSTRTAVSRRGHFEDFRPGFRFLHICHVD